MISDFMVSLGFTSIRAVCVCKRGKFESCESRKGFFFFLCSGKFIALNLIVHSVLLKFSTRWIARCFFVRFISRIYRIIKDNRNSRFDFLDHLNIKFVHVDEMNKKFSFLLLIINRREFFFFT